MTDSLAEFVHADRSALTDLEYCETVNRLAARARAGLDSGAAMIAPSALAVAESTSRTHRWFRLQVLALVEAAMLAALIWTLRATTMEARVETDRAETMRLGGIAQATRDDLQSRRDREAAEDNGLDAIAVQIEEGSPGALHQALVGLATVRERASLGAPDTETGRRVREAVRKLTSRPEVQLAIEACRLSTTHGDQP